MFVKNKLYYCGVLFLIIGIVIFGYYYVTGEVFFRDYDEVSQIVNAKITDYDVYEARGKFEFTLLIISLLSFITGLILLCVNKKILRKKV